MSFWKLILLVLVMICPALPVRADVGNGSSSGTLSPEEVQMVKAEAEQGDLKSQYLVGMMYYAGKYQEQNYAEAAKWFRGAGEKGDANSQYMYALMLYGGLGMPVDYKAAADWMTRAAGQGLAGAEADLARMYLFGKGVNQDAAAAFTWNQKSALQGNRTAQFQLGQAYRDGQGTAKNETEALAWFDLAAKAGEANAAQEHDKLAVSLGDDATRAASQRSDEIAGQIKTETGALPSPPAPSEGLAQSDLQRLQASAEQGDVRAQLMLGDIYAMGLGVEKDTAKGMAYYQKAADQGSASARTALDRNREILDKLASEQSSPTPAPSATPAATAEPAATATPATETTSSSTVPDQMEELRKAARSKWDAIAPGLNELQKLADGGNDKAECLLGEYYYYSSQQDCGKSLKWLRKSAEQGNLKAQKVLALLYSAGMGIPKNLPEAAKWYRRAADKGDGYSAYGMALLYFDGLGVPKDRAEGMKWLTRAAEQDEDRAQWDLARLYRDGGDGVKKSDVLAYKWARNSAILGNKDAQCMVAIFLDVGMESVPQDRVEALAWCKIAAAEGVQGAATDLPRAEAELGPEKTAQADERSKKIVQEMTAAQQAKAEKDAKVAAAEGDDDPAVAAPAPSARTKDFSPVENFRHPRHRSDAQ